MMMLRSWRTSFAPARGAVFALLAGLVVLVGVLPGCNRDSNPNVLPVAVPVEAFRGPTWLRGTVGSMATLRNGEPLLVSGYALAVNLENESGSSEVPAFIRGFLVNEMRKRRVPNPEQVLFDTSTAVVAVEGLIPAGAADGDRFDLMVTAIDRQTVSLEGGDVWSTQLSPGPLDASLRFIQPAAEGGGAVFVDPSAGEVAEGEIDPRRQALVVAGGRVTEERVLELVLNQPSWQRSRLLADRINERFPKAPRDRFETARPLTDVLVRLRVPSYWRSRPNVFLDQVMVLFTQRSPGFDTSMTLSLAERLVRSPEDRDVVVSAWQALGRGILPALRDVYEHEVAEVRLAALEAGAGLDDGRAARLLTAMIDEADDLTRLRIASALSLLPDNLEAARGLRRLLDDESELVRIAAYEAMAMSGDPVLDRIPVFGERGLKMVIDQIPASRPMIYVTFARVPRLVFFGAPIGVEPDVLARAWNGRLMVRTVAGSPMSVFYQSRERGTRRLELRPNLTELAYVLAHRPTNEQPEEGFDLSYGQTVDAIYELREAAGLDAAFRMRPSPLSELIESMRPQQEAVGRPRTAARGEGASGILDEGRVAGR
ncbi:flagellar basal body P-ring protein FlgI [Mucisphaera sp.]|uniref:flagellar basal body P-ring protein FlgI n=1 Tax=Mucisphaera sp. TaxID=2913024 RepID=UPI003D0B312A